MLEKTYQPAEIEARVSHDWEEAHAFKSGQSGRAGLRRAAGARPKKNVPYSIVIPPPNVTGSLHMGHALNNTLQDILCRFERMRGRDVLWQPGTDHAGIATQMVVERQLAADKQPTRRELGREEFVRRVWAWKDKSGGAIINQLKRLGASCDWSRERFTMDEGLSRAVIKVFVALYKEKLIYKDQRLVNWDPEFQTAISDLEVEQREVRGHLWYFKYPLRDNRSNFIVIATTRPETMLADVAVAVHPRDERYNHLIGKSCVLPLVGREIPIIGDEYTDPDKGTGAVKITPAHDFNDFEVGRRHGLALINIFDAYARLNDNAPEKYRGLDRFEARKRIVADLEALGLVDKIERHTHVVPHGDRSGAPLEPRLTDQWYVDSKTLAQPAIAAVESGKTEFVPKNWEKTYFEWMRNIQPWCISRQLWWGHQIPAWYGPDGKIIVAHNEAEAKADALEYSGKDVELKRDEDVLDTWFSSALWPFSTLGWPDATPELDRYYPTSVLVTGFDIIFFWVARMMMMGLHFTNQVPFSTVYIHALVRDEKGQKMSKSKGNVIDPLLLINQYGADALRFTLAIMAAQGRDIKMSKHRVEGNRNFATKLWNAARFAEMNECVRQRDFDPKSVKTTLNRWITGEVERTTAAVTRSIENYKFNEAAGAVYEFTWGLFCDWYLELIKPTLNATDEAAKAETRATTAWVLDQILKLLHPFMPFITEELWGRLVEVGAARQSLLALSQWPVFDGLIDADADAEIDWLIKLVSDVRSVRAEMNVPPRAKIGLVLIGASTETRGRAVRHEETIKRLARLDSISFEKSAPKGSVQIVVGETTACLPLAGVIDMAAEKRRLAKGLADAEGDKAKMEAKLSNPSFLAKAREEAVEEARERKAELENQIGKLKAALKRVEAAA
jgi:valyl-tRNA synthetase